MFQLHDLNDNEFNGVQNHTIPPLNGSDTGQDSDKSDDENEENRICCFKRKSVIINKTNNKHSSETACPTETAH